MKVPIEGILGEKVLSQDLWCVFCASLLCALAASAFISLTCLLQKIQGLEGLRQCGHEMLCLLRQFIQQTLVPQLLCSQTQQNPRIQAPTLQFEVGGWHVNKWGDYNSLALYKAQRCQKGESTPLFPGGLTA